MSHQNTQIVESLRVIMRNLGLMVENLKAAEDLNETQKKVREDAVLRPLFACLFQTVAVNFLASCS